MRGGLNGNYPAPAPVKGVVKGFVVTLAVLIASGCAGTHHDVASKTRLNVVVYRGHAKSRYTLDCRPAGGSAPNAAKACRALEDFLPRREGTQASCVCLLSGSTNEIMVSGVLDGSRLSRAVEVSRCSACGLGSIALSDATDAFSAFGIHA